MRRLLTVALVATVVLTACTDDGGGEGADDETTDAPAESVRVITLNVLHGFPPPISPCVEQSDFCRAPTRVDLLYDQIEAADCPELVGLQEIGERQEDLIPPSLDQLCGGQYELAWEGESSPDRPMIFSSLPIVDQGFADLAAFPWSAYWVQVDSEIGTVDFLTTHMASSSNDPTCTPENCPPVCDPGISTNECNAVEVVDFLDQNADPDGVAIIGGDLNARPGEPTIDTFLDAGYVDTWLEAGNEECEPETGVGCTGGGNDQTDLSGLDDPTRLMNERIDYVLVEPGPNCDGSFNAEGFANEPLEEPVDDLVWVSDHTGLLVTVSCD
jgi:hypothetical protein